MIDIDHFKHINDNFGHLAGDEILARVARELFTRIRPVDSFARFGGEEFILFQPAWVRMTRLRWRVRSKRS